LTVDVITEVAFGESFHLLTKAENNTFNAPFLDSLDLALKSVWDVMYFPIIRVIVDNAPPAVAVMLSQPVARFQDLIRAVTDTVAKFRKLKSFGKSLDHDIVFGPMSQLDDKVLLVEASDILVAGSDTTATTLAIAIQKFAEYPGILSKLKSEMKEAGIVTELDYKLVELEKPPYLVCSLDICCAQLNSIRLRVSRKLCGMLWQSRDDFHGLYLMVQSLS
jgi:hypothetical protein